MSPGRCGRTMGVMKQLSLLALPVVLPLMFSSAPAMAASTPNLRVTMVTPAVLVDHVGHYSVRVANIGTANAASVRLTIALPRTHTSPQVYILGTLGARDGRCTLAGTSLTCNLLTVARNGGYTDVAFDLTLPYSTAPLAITASATTTTPNEQNPANNQVTITPAPTPIATQLAGDYTGVARHCTGTGLTSFFECELFPSSIAGFGVTLANDGSAGITGEPTVDGSWYFTSPDLLHIDFAEGGDPIGEINARSVGNGCFEGPMTFSTPSTWTVLYEVCVAPQ